MFTSRLDTRRFRQSLRQQAFSALACLLLSCGLFACGGTSGDSTTETTQVTLADYRPESTTPETDAVDPVLLAAQVATYNKFALALYQYHAQLENRQNLVIDPGSAAQGLGMMLNGANTDTAEQIRNVFSFSGDEVSALELELLRNIIASGEGRRNENAAWGQEGYLFQTGFLDRITTTYRAELQSLDFVRLGAAYRPTIDAWVNGVLSTTVSGVAPDSNTPEETRLVLSSAADLSSAWESPAEVSEVATGLFERLDGEQFWVPMVRWQGSYKTFADADLTVFELPLAQGGNSLLVLMPTAGRFELIRDNLETRLDAAVQGLQPAVLDILLPRFATSSSGSLEDFLKQRGMIEAFNEASADFSGINGRGYAYLKGMRLSTNVNVAGSGTQAQGVSAAAIEATADEPADLFNPGWGAGLIITTDNCPFESIYVGAGLPDARPFIYLLRDNATQAVLFAGQLLDAGGEEAGHWECQWPVLQLPVLQ